MKVQNNAIYLGNDMHSARKIQGRIRNCRECSVE